MPAATASGSNAKPNSAAKSRDHNQGNVGPLFQEDIEAGFLSEENGDAGWDCAEIAEVEDKDKPSII